jgi:hypothetical protein
MQTRTIRWAFALVLIGCADSQGEFVERPQLTQAECEARDGNLVGDSGDGAVHRQDYVCATGKKPVGAIVTSAGEPFGVEGAVCCPR